MKRIIAMMMLLAFTCIVSSVSAVPTKVEPPGHQTELSICDQIFEMPAIVPATAMEYSVSYTFTAPPGTILAIYDNNYSKRPVIGNSPMITVSHAISPEVVRRSGSITWNCYDIYDPSLELNKYNTSVQYRHDQQTYG